MYAVLVWYVVKEDKNNSQVIDLQMRPPGALGRAVMCIISKGDINGHLVAFRLFGIDFFETQYNAITFSDTAKRRT